MYIPCPAVQYLLAVLVARCDGGRDDTGSLLQCVALPSLLNTPNPRATHMQLGTCGRDREREREILPPSTLYDFACFLPPASLINVYTALQSYSLPSSHHCRSRPQSQGWVHSPSSYTLPAPSRRSPLGSWSAREPQSEQRTGTSSSSEEGGRGRCRWPGGRSRHAPPTVCADCETTTEA